MSSVLLEALIVAALGMGLAFAANSWRADGLELGRDYFPQSLTSKPGPESRQQGDPPRAQGSATDPAPDAPDALDDGEDLTSHERTAAITDLHEVAGPGDAIHAHVAERLAEKGLTAVSHLDAEALWRDPMFHEYEATIFLDARRAEQYSEGHIPGAWHFDPFYPERSIDELLPLLTSAMTIVVYCKGGECDDSESAALFLLNLGAADPGRLSIYVGGVEAWTAAQLPLERGLRGSGELSETP